MATLKIKLKEGFFDDVDGRYVTEVTPTHVTGNGWVCNVLEDGSIRCEAVRPYSDGVHSMRYEIKKDGFAKLTLKVGKGPVRTIRKGYVLPRGAKLTDGLIGLSGGYVDDRYGYFRNPSFQRFLDRFGITAVVWEDPNQTLVLRDAHYGGGYCKSTLFSDGKKTEICSDSGRTAAWHDDCPGTSAYEWETTYEVSGARWAIYTVYQCEGDSRNYARILYTLERNVVKLEPSLLMHKDIAQFIQRE